MIDYSLQVLDRAVSTQDVVKDLAGAAAPEGIVVQALEQTGGRGRHGRAWLAGQGNLTFSVLLRPDVAARNVGSLALVAGLSLHKTLIRDGLQLKWPNDLLLDGKKCAGLLLETELNADACVDWVVLGLGVNVASSPSEDFAYLGGSVSDIFERFLSIFAGLYQQWQNDGFCSMKDEWLSCAHQEGSALMVKIGEDHVRGAFAGLDDAGNLLLDCDGVIKTITSGEVFL